jgi:hypothetical protein
VSGPSNEPERRPPTRTALIAKYVDNPWVNTHNYNHEVPLLTPKQCFFVGSSKKGSETPKHEIDLIKQRLRDAEEHYRQHFNKERR